MSGADTTAGAPGNAFAAMLDEHDVYRHFPAEHRQAGSVPVDFVRLVQEDFEATDPACEAFVLAVPLVPTAAVLEVDYGEGWRTFDNVNTSSYLNPAPAGATYRQTGHADLLFITTPLSAVAARLGLDGGPALREALRPMHDRFGHDPAVRVQSLALWDAAARHGPFASLAVDHGLLALVAVLLRDARPGEALLPAPPPRLDDARMRRVVEYIEAHLAEPIRLDDLAAVAAYSIFHFSRAFRDATGHSPQRYVTRRRTERAKGLLRGTLPLSQVAHACGFASQSHFGAVFKAHTGVSPGAYRARVRG